MELTLQGVYKEPPGDQDDVREERGGGAGSPGEQFGRGS